MLSFVDVDRDHDLAYILLRPELRDRAAVVARSLRVADDVVLDLDANDQLVGIELLRASSRLDLDRITAEPSELIVGVKEAAEMLGVERSNFIRDHANKPDFPSAIAELASGRFWLRPTIERYIRARETRVPRRADTQGTASITDEEIRRLLAGKAETPNLDYKAGFAWTRDNRDKKYELARDLIAMANTKDGGRIVLGVRDDDFDFLGVDDTVYSSFDANGIVRLLHDNASPKVSCEVVKRIIDEKRVVVLDVAEFSDEPIICDNTVMSSDGKRTILRRGTIYIRTPAASTEEISSPDEMRCLLGRALTKKGDELLQTINHLLTGKPVAQTPTAADSYSKEIEAAHRLIGERLGEELQQRGHIEVIAFPTSYDPKRIKTIAETENIVRRCEVALRGWNFPHTDKQDASPFTEGFQSSTIWGVYREAYRLYRSGLFVWKGALWEDADGQTSRQGGKVLSLISVIYSFTEFFVFLSRLYSQIAPDATIHIEIGLHGCKDRDLDPLDPRIVWFPGRHTSREDVIQESEDVRAVELRASQLEIAARFVKHVFHVFNWREVTDQTISTHQQTLLHRRG